MPSCPPTHIGVSLAPFRYGRTVAPPFKILLLGATLNWPLTQSGVGQPRPPSGAGVPSPLSPPPPSILALAASLPLLRAFALLPAPTHLYAPSRFPFSSPPLFSPIFPLAASPPPPSPCCWSSAPTRRTRAGRKREGCGRRSTRARGTSGARRSRGSARRRPRTRRCRRRCCGALSCGGKGGGGGRLSGANAAGLQAQMLRCTLVQGRASSSSRGGKGGRL